MRNIQRRFVWLAIALSGCSNGFGSDVSSATGPRPGRQPCELRFSSASCQHLIVQPFNANVLLGDTIRFWSWSDDESASAIWTVQGDALAFFSGDTLVAEVATYTDRVRVKALGVGQGTIVANSLTREARSLLTIADSSIIATLDAGLAPQGVLRIGTQWLLTPALRDAAGNHYTAQPVWSSSDSVTVDFVRPTGSGSALTYARMRKAGAVKLIASFLSFRDTVEIGIVP